MYVVVDSGTTNTRLYLMDGPRVMHAVRGRVGVRDTSITGSADTLRKGIVQLFAQLIAQAGVDPADIRCAVVSGMITSELGLLELPHLEAPAGLLQLRAGIRTVAPRETLDIPCPVHYIPGVKNRFDAGRGPAVLRDVDFMRGEEVQCVGVLASELVTPPCTIVALSSHTKYMGIDEQGRITHMTTTISGQFFEALQKETSVGKSLRPVAGESPSTRSMREIADIAVDCVTHGGLLRAMLMPRFMEVLLDTASEERRWFVDAAIACDDMQALQEFRAAGCAGDHFVLYGHANRCELYEYLIAQRCPCAEIRSITNKDDIDALMIRGAWEIAQPLLEK